MAVLTLAQAITDALDIALDQDDHVLLIGEDVGKTGGVFRLSNGLYEKYGSERIIDAPVDQQHFPKLRMCGHDRFVEFDRPRYRFDRLLSLSVIE